VINYISLYQASVAEATHYLTKQTRTQLLQILQEFDTATLTPEFIKEKSLLQEIIDATT